MAIIRNTASGLLKGRVGNTSYYVSGQRQIARVSQNSSNYGESARRSYAQQARRVLWANLVNFYKVSKSWMKYAFETKTAKQSDYNKFMSVNLNTSAVMLTKEEAALGGCVLEPFTITQGSLPTITTTLSGSVFSTDLALETITISETTTIGQFSQALINENSQVQEGWQLSLLTYYNALDSNGIPQVYCYEYEVTLDTTSVLLLFDFLPNDIAVTSSGTLGLGNAQAGMAVAFVWSFTDSTGTKVSTQSLICNNATLLSTYTTATKKAAAIESYGLDVDAFLMSGSSSQNPSGQSLYLVNVMTPAEEAIATGSALALISDMSESTWTLNLSNTFDASSISWTATDFAGHVVQGATAVHTNGTSVITGNLETNTYSSWVRYIDITIDGVTIRGEFISGDVD